MGEIKDYVSLYIENSDLIASEANKISISLENNIKREAPYDQGRLKRSIRVDTRVNKQFALITGYWDEGLAPHGIYVIAGTRPHIIRPREGKALKTPYGFYRKVNHPGTKGDDFLGRGLARTLEAYG